MQTIAKGHGGLNGTLGIDTRDEVGAIVSGTESTALTASEASRVGIRLAQCSSAGMMKLTHSGEQAAALARRLIEESSRFMVWSGPFTRPGVCRFGASACMQEALSLRATYNGPMQRKMPADNRQQVLRKNIRRYLPAAGFVAWGVYSLLALAYLAYESALAGIVCGAP